MTSSAKQRIRIIPFIAAILAAAAVLRLLSVVTDFSGAMAQTTEQSETDSRAINDAAPAPKSESIAAERINLRLDDARAALDTRAAELDTREKVLEAAEQRLAENAASVRADIARLEALQSEQARSELAEFDALSTAYERMKPRDAARIFEILEEDILVPVAAGMRTQSLSAVLAEMQPEKARALTRLLANRPANKAVRTSVAPPL
jgi:flagellar motility protein MotE (MotC chaperone)